MPGQTEFVQPIALLRAGTHEDAIRAVALASVTAYVKTSEDPAWLPWVERRFAKSVRRSSKSGPFNRVEELAAVKVVVGEAQALGFLPTTYPEMNPTVRGFQVENTELPRVGWDEPKPVTELNPLVVLNESAGMTTGKAAAQAAHGLFSWYLTLEDVARTCWVDSGQPFSLVGTEDPEFSALAQMASVVIADAGFTEIAPGTNTVAVI